MKKFLDIFISIILFIILSPILAIISILIKTTSKGPAVFTQRRIGKDNKEFMLYKFRTMEIDTPNVATHLLKNPEQYITPIGRVLRKTSLDELPQLMNIIKGEMSFIGPRPALYNQYDLIKLRTKAGVHKLVPGVTGWAQINGRDVLTVPQKVKFDEYYLHHKSFLFDMKIFFMTVLKVLRSEGIVEGRTGSIVENEVKESV